MPNVVLSPIGGAGGQFFDNNGNVLSGGLIYTYAAGTTTPLATYTSIAGTTANANPVVLNSAGRVGGEIWLIAGTGYKIVIKTSAGTTLATYDNVSGTSGVSGTSVSIYSYGASTALSNNSTAINNTIAAVYALGGGDVIIPEGTWNCTATITLLDGVNLVGLGKASHLNFASATITSGDDCILASGAVTATTPNFNTSIVKGDNTITFASAPTGVTAGDVLLVYNSTDSSWSAASTNYRAGEFVRVRSVSGGVVTLDGQTFDAYTTGGTTTIYKVTPITCQVRNLRCTFKTGLTGIRFTYGFKCLVEDLDLTGSDESQVNFNRCFDFDARRVHAWDVLAVATTNYGIVVSNSQRGIISGCHLDTTRHGLAMGSGVTPSSVGTIPCRDILVEGCVINSQTAGVVAADGHGNCEFVTFSGNQILSGIQLGGDNNSIIGNFIRTCNASASKSVAVFLLDLLGPNFVIAHNRIVATDAVDGTSSAIISVARNNNEWAYTTRSGTLKIANNDIDYASFQGAGIVVRNSWLLPATATIDLVIQGNRLHGFAGATNRLAIYVLGTSDGTAGFKTVVVDSNTLIGCSMLLDMVSAGYTQISNNTVLRASQAAIVYDPCATYSTVYQAEEEMIVVEDNRVYRPNKGGILITGSDAGTRSFAHIRRNTSVSTNQDGTSSSTIGTSVRVVTLNTATVEGNTWGKLPNDSVSGQTRVFTTSGITTLSQRENNNVGTLVTETIATTTNRFLDTTFGYNITGAAAANVLTSIVSRRCVVPATAPGGYAKGSVAANANHNYDVQVNGVSKGTIAWTAASATAAFTWAADVTLAPGDRITVHPTTDTTLVNVGIVIAAYAY